MQVRWTKYAARCLSDVVDNIVERRGKAAARAIVGRLFGAVERLSALPWTGAPWRPADDERYRRLVLGEHVLIYRVDEPDLILVLGFATAAVVPWNPPTSPKRRTRSSGDTRGVDTSEQDARFTHSVA